MRHLFRPALAAAALLSLLATGAQAQSGSEGVFTLVNDTDNNLLVGFYTSEDADAFSDNWLGEALLPGEAAEAEFFADSGPCVQYFVAGWLGSDMETEVLDDIIEIDICEASVVYLADNEIYFE